MIARYSRPEMSRIWTQESKYEAWLKVELAVCEVYAKRGIIPTDALGRIKAGAKVDAARIDEIEARTRHDVIAFLTNLEEPGNAIDHLLQIARERLVSQMAVAVDHQYTSRSCPTTTRPL